MSVSHVFEDGAHFSEQINSENLPYNIQNMDGKSLLFFFYFDNKIDYSLEFNSKTPEYFYDDLKMSSSHWNNNKFGMKDVIEAYA